MVSRTARKKASRGQSLSPHEGCSGAFFLLQTSGYYELYQYRYPARLLACLPACLPAFLLCSFLAFLAAGFCFFCFFCSFFFFSFQLFQSHHISRSSLSLSKTFAAGFFFQQAWVFVHSLFLVLLVFCGWCVHLASWDLGSWVLLGYRLPVTGYRLPVYYNCSTKWSPLLNARRRSSSLVIGRRSSVVAIVALCSRRAAAYAHNTYATVARTRANPLSGHACRSRFALVVILVAAVVSATTPRQKGVASGVWRHPSARVCPDPPARTCHRPLSPSSKWICT